MPLSPGRERQEQPQSSGELAVVHVRPRRAATVPAPSAGAVACGGRGRVQGQLAARAGGARRRTSATRYEPTAGRASTKCRAIAEGWPYRAPHRSMHLPRAPLGNERHAAIPDTVRGHRQAPSSLRTEFACTQPVLATATRRPLLRTDPHPCSSRTAALRCARRRAPSGARSRARKRRWPMASRRAPPSPSKDISDPTGQNHRTSGAPGAELHQERGRVRASGGGLWPLDARLFPGEHLDLLGLEDHLGPSALAVRHRLGPATGMHDATSGVFR